MDKNLIAYIDQRNALEKSFMRFSSTPDAAPRELDMKNLSAQDRRELLDQLESDLSPKILTWDGELRGAKLAKKTKLLNGAKAALEAMQ